jgi:precorrin-3B C17-methyltransferase
MIKRTGKLFIVGIGAGGLDEMTLRARKAIASSQVIVGYSRYTGLIAPLCKGKIVIASGMGREVERCKAALREALLGKKVSLVSSGDSGIYGMAGLVLEIALGKGIEDRSAIEIIPGVPAFVAAAARAGAPLMNDFAVLSLSDLLTPWKTIEKRLDAAASGDFVVCLYNPKSRQRVEQIKKAQKIFLKYRGKSTPCAVLRNVSRPGETVRVTTLGELLQQTIDMRSIVIIGNSQTTGSGAWLMTARGYKMEG